MKYITTEDVSNIGDEIINVMLTMAMISEPDKEKQNKVALFLFNDIHN